ncbi:MAG: metallophosphoesterase family protein [Archaeoglobaceae archaeon]|nr:serine/threonine protein phosphatase [Archaeoglobaceae archaeon]MDW7989837.1 metallophosphoesterase family protein [Archaeoglobaceae archaeon]
MDLLELIDRAKSLMDKKMLEIEENLCTIIGDVHADLEALEIIEREIVGKAIFLGDYADRGDYPIEVYERILSMFLEGEAYLIRGNHETEEVYPHELPWQLNYYENGEEIYKSLKNLWERMPLSAILNGEVFLVHGGVPCRLVKREILKNPDEGTALELMWNDPWEKEDCGNNFRRGLMFFFGKKATRRLFEDIGARLVVRSHEPYKILKVEQDGMLVTIGSCASPYGLTSFALLKVDSREKFRNGHDFVRKFGFEFNL